MDPIRMHSGFFAILMISSLILICFSNHMPVGGKEDFASAEASKGLCGRPLQSFAPILIFV